MIPTLSVVTSVKDYLEVVHKLIEYDSESYSKYTELGPLVTYIVLSLKSFLMDFISLSWLKNIWSLPILIPDISSAMISEISVLDGYFHNAFQFLETPALTPNEKTIGLITGIEKFTIGLLNSCFLFLPTSTAHIITLRRFVMQGLEAGYIAGLGTIAGNVFWLASVILGWRFFVIPWLSLDILRYVLGFALLVKYMWDSYNERKMVLEDISKRKIFLLNFLLALTEQTSIYPFISNISISPEASILETFPSDNYIQFLFIHVSYLLGIAVGSFCLLQFTCWFWENPAFQLYMWVISSFKVSTSFYYKALNFMFLYLTMLSAISSIPYYGLDYTITNPLGFVNDDRLIQDKSILETSFLGNKASDRNTRRNRGRHGRRERWKRRIRKYRTFDASLYDQGIYDLFTIEDLNYGFDRFWLRRKLRNHRVRFRFFPGPWMRSFKKQLAKPRLESYTGPRIEFFRILFEQVYHPSFHGREIGAGQVRASNLPPQIPTRSQSTNITSPLYTSASTQGSNTKSLAGQPSSLYIGGDTRNLNLMGISNKETSGVLKYKGPSGVISNNNQLNQNTSLSTITTSAKGMYGIKDNLIHENSMLRKFVRKLDSRLKTAEIAHNLEYSTNNIPPKTATSNNLELKQSNSFKKNTIYSKRWKEIFSKIYHEPKTQIPTSNLFFKNVHRNFYNSSLALPNKMNISVLDSLDQKQAKQILKRNKESIKKQSSRMNTLSNKDLQILRYRSTLSLQEKEATPAPYKWAPGLPNYGKELTKNTPIVRSPPPKGGSTDDSLGGPALSASADIRANDTRESPSPLPNSLLTGESTFSNIYRKTSTDRNSLNKTDDSKYDIKSQQPFVLLHPLKFYLQQEAALQRKLRYYTPNIFRKFSVENNAPYFRVMMRRYFYNYKPTNRWERTMKVGSLRKARRKTTRTPRKLRLLASESREDRISSPFGGTNPSAELSPPPINMGGTVSPAANLAPQYLSTEGGVGPYIRDPASLLSAGGPHGSPPYGGSPPLKGRAAPTSLTSNGSPYKQTNGKNLLSDSGIQQTSDLAQRTQKPTFNYSVVSKKASRYRYQIYKDVMQHWYYSPFNRLLLKFDVDSFIRRQPKTHFLTSKEENLLHLRRFFLSEHYNTLRWYTNMEHYRTMKTKIGGSKSFSSRAYNQQFAGTFKKIRHLFAITPTINSAFPFDSNLSNIVLDKGSNASNVKSLGVNSNNSNINILEPQKDTTVLKFDQPLYNEYPNNSKNPLLNPLVIHEELLSPYKFVPSEDLLTQSQKVVREYLNNSSQLRKNYIKQLVDNKNYASLTSFLYNGQKLRGNKPTTNETKLSYQEKDYLLTSVEKENIEKQYNSPAIQNILRQNLNEIVAAPSPSKVEFSPPSGGKDSSFLEENSIEFSSIKGETTKPLQANASLENLYTTFLKNWKRRVNNQESLKNYLTRRIDKREKRKINKEKTLQQKLKTLNDWISNSKPVKTIDRDVSSPTYDKQQRPVPYIGDQPGALAFRGGPIYTSPPYLGGEGAQDSQYITSGLQKAIADGINTANAENEKRSSYGDVKKLDTLRLSQKQKLNREIQVATHKLHTITTQLEKKPTSIRTINYLKNKISTIYQTFSNTYGGLSLFNSHKITKLVKPIKLKSLNNWRKKQRAIGKQKRLRKEFKLLLTKKQTAQQTALSLPNRKKRIDTPIYKQGTVNLPSTYTSLDLHNILANDTTEKNSFFNNNYIASFFNFKRERSPQRRYRVRRNRGVFRKRNLGDLMKKDIKNFFNKNIARLGTAEDRARPVSAAIRADDTRENLSDASLTPADIVDRNRFYAKMHSLKGGATTYKGNFLKDERILPTQGPTNANVLQFKQARVKQRKNKQRKLRSWKQKRMTLRASQKRRKYLKRRRYSISKIRVLSKQFKRVKSKLEIHNWWWKQYLPSIQASTDALWQIEKDRLIQQKLAELSPQEIMQRDSVTINNQLQIGNKDFKPLALPEAMRIQSTLKSDTNLSRENNIQISTPNNNLSSIQATPQNKEIPQNKETPQIQIVNQLYENLLVNKNLTGESNNNNTNNTNNLVGSSGVHRGPVGLLPNTSLPFYAGWDESLRKFVVTNRLLSRQDAGYEVDKSFIEENSIEFSSRKLEYFLPEGEKNSTFVSPNNSVAKPDIYKGTSRASNTENAELRQLRANDSFESDFYSNSIRPPKEKFTEAPLKGMNAATTLYWQIPFTTYDPDQFFALGMDGFSPLGWRKMLFRHSILKTWLGDKTMRNKKKDSVSPTTFSGESTIGIKNSINHQDLLSTLQKTKKGSYLINNRDNSNRQDGFNTSRRLKKRLLRVKKHPRTPVWFPSGPLLNQVLPVHYIYVFYKRTRLPRNRYLSRRLLSVNNIKNSETFNALISSNPSLYNYDFTLRKRLKPKRKYHLKHDSSIVIPRRLKFLNWIQQNPLTDDKFQFSSQQDINSLIRWRPLSSKKINKSFSELMNEQKTLRAKRQQRLAGVSPMDQPSLRVKQLKRRVQRQVIRAVWRYRPRAGGFVWPGDYLKLELTQAPKLKSTKISSDNLQSNISDLTPQNKLRNTSESNQNVDTLPKRKTKRKKKRTLVEWQVQPKKYLYAKHNAKVLKKKLERAHRSGNTPLQQKGKVEV